MANNMKILKRVVPIVTKTSSFHDLTEFLFFSFQEDDRTLVEDILVEREKGFENELQKLKQERDAIEKSSRIELQRERDLCGSKVGWAVMEKEKMEEKLRTEKGLNDELKKLIQERDIMEHCFRVKYEKGLKCERDLWERKVSVVEMEKEKLRVEFDERVKSLEEDLEYEVVRREELKRERDLLESKLCLLEKGKWEVVERVRKELEGENRELRNKIDLNNETLGKEFAMVEERLAKLKGVLGSGNAETDRASRNDCRGLVVSVTDSHYKVKTESSFLEYATEDGGCSENNINCKRKRSINETEDDKDSTAFNKNIERLLESGCKKIGLPVDFFRKVDPDALGDSKANSPPKFSSTCVKQWKHEVDMLSAFRNDPELCMAAVCALYRQSIPARVSNSLGFSSMDSVRGTKIAKYLIDNDPENKLSRSLLEVKQECPSMLRSCQRLANQYGQQLFAIYRQELDPFFCPKS